MILGPLTVPSTKSTSGGHELSNGHSRNAYPMPLPVPNFARISQRPPATLRNWPLLTPAQVHSPPTYSVRSTRLPFRVNVFSTR